MQTSPLLLASGIRRLFPIMKQRSAALYKGDDNVQDGFDRLRAFHHPVRPPDGLHRPSVDGLGPRRSAQWGSPLFRPLGHLSAKTDKSRVPSRPDLNYPPTTMAPFRGHFSWLKSSTPLTLGPLRQISRVKQSCTSSRCALAYRIPKCSRCCLNTTQEQLGGTCISSALPVRPFGGPGCSKRSGCRDGKLFLQLGLQQPRKPTVVAA